MKLPVLFLLATLTLTAAAQQDDAKGGPPPVGENKDIHAYIRQGWQVLSRSMNDCKTLGDTKLQTQPILYLPAEITTPEEVTILRKKCGIQIAPLPKKIDRAGDLRPDELTRQGLLYLPNPYVVPGGRFNEMYGWDSYFIILGLVRDQQVDLARGMVENFFYEIEHYGSVLNANRTYYLTRSQPPLLTSMILAVYDANNGQGPSGVRWLQRGYDNAQRDWRIWNTEPHLAGNTGLSRYYDYGDGPVPEMGDDPSYYNQVASYLLTHPDPDHYLITDAPNSGSAKTGASAKTAGPELTAKSCPPADQAGTEKPCAPEKKVHLSADYYKGDRAMRESGYDISYRFGPFSGSTHHYAPVCLNSLLYKAENDLARMAAVLGRPAEVKQWKDRAALRKSRMTRYLWNARSGMFYDYNFQRARQSTYNFAASFYPLWAGAATREQARLQLPKLPLLERPGGIATSDRITGVQWDMPYGWAPVQYFVEEGLRKYGFKTEANRVASHWNSMVEENYLRDGTIREKYNVVDRTTTANVSAGYKANVVGFGWTNGVYLEFQAAQGK